VFGLVTSVLVRDLVGSPAPQAARAARLIDDDAVEYGVSPVALAECAHVLRTQYDVGQRDIIDALIALVQRANVRVIGQRTDVLVETLVRARDLPGRPIPDAMIVAASLAADAVPLASFDRDQRRYGVEVRNP
jgi:predicted nucleic acid-binding protein